MLSHSNIFRALFGAVLLGMVHGHPFQAICTPSPRGTGETEIQGHKRHFRKFEPQFRTEFWNILISCLVWQVSVNSEIHRTSPAELLHFSDCGVFLSWHGETTVTDKIVAAPIPSPSPSTKASISRRDNPAEHLKLSILRWTASCFPLSVWEQQDEQVLLFQFIIVALPSASRRPSFVRAFLQ
jgi:hypothetical protein